LKIDKIDNIILPFSSKIALLGETFHKKAISNKNVFLTKSKNLIDTYEVL
jgi:hypothetical protein